MNYNKAVERLYCTQANSEYPRKQAYEDAKKMVDELEMNNRYTEMLEDKYYKLVRFIKILEVERIRGVRHNVYRINFSTSDAEESADVFWEVEQAMDIVNCEPNDV